MGSNPDDTIRVSPPGAGPRPSGARGRRARLIAGGAAAVILAAGIGGGGWLYFAPPAPVAPPHGTPAPPAAPGLTVEVRSLAALEAASDPVTRFSRLAENRDILVITFASLAAQGEAMNRLAAFVEKAGQPRNRVLNDYELATATAPDPETYYLGHDYDAAALRRFFALADRDAIRLNAAEEELRRLLTQEGLLAAGATGALVTAAAPGPELDEAARRAVLWHEMSHGEYFTRPAYADWTRRFWRETLTDAERDAFRAFLTKLDYDPADEDLMANETQAFLMHTPDPRFFSPALVGLPVETVSRLQAAFRAGMPDGWLKGGAL